MPGTSKLSGKCMSHHSHLKDGPHHMTKVWDKEHSSAGHMQIIHQMVHLMNGTLLILRGYLPGVYSTGWCTMRTHQRRKWMREREGKNPFCLPSIHSPRRYEGWMWIYIFTFQTITTNVNIYPNTYMGVLINKRKWTDVPNRLHCIHALK